MKKNVEYYMALPYRMEIIPEMEEGGFVVSFPDLPGCLTCVDKIEDIVLFASDAKRAWLEAALDAGLDIPEPAREASAEEYSGQFKLRIPKSLHKSLALNAKKEGISMNQYCIYLLSKNDASHVSQRV